MSSLVRSNSHCIWRRLDLSYPDPSRNLALEEALFRASVAEGFQPTFRLWVNPPTVVVGRFQDVRSEVDLKVCHQDHVQIVRRFTGGGAVFHDKGNINFTILGPRPKEMSVSELHEFNSSVALKLLERFGARGCFVPPNSINVSGRKISGAAAALNRDFELWHASILISTDLQLLNRTLSPSINYHNTNFVRSRWQPTTNLTATIGNRVDLEEVKCELSKSFETVFQVSLESGHIRRVEEAYLSELYASKYSSREWNLSGHIARMN